jgi:hypothetical protein
MNATPPCPNGLYEFKYECCDILLVCHFEYIPAEKGSTDSWGAPYEPCNDELMALSDVYIDGTDIDIYLILHDEIHESVEEQALKDFKAYQ